ncbi:MAG: PrsW family intramembrane metalloprotease [Archangium sp.]|nr:PrsW family intramembrane metalloprotease [Archangium sp.]
MQFILALSGVIPAIVLMAVMARFDAKRPEPKTPLYLATALGGLSTIPVIFIQLGLEKFNPGGYSGALYTAFGVAALTEECAKAAVLYFVVWRSTAFDERLDGIVYATRAGLGFALVENVGYLMGSESMPGFFGTFVVRAVLAVPGHAIYAGFMGYWAARKKFDNVGPGLLGGLGIAIFLHGAYDAALFLIGVLAKQGGLAVLLVFPLIAVPIVVVVGGYRRLKKHAEEALRLDDVTHAPRPQPRLPFGLGFVLR